MKAFLSALAVSAFLPLAGDTLAQQKTNALDHNCMCRAGGKLYPIGETICLRTYKGDLLATCAMSQNVLNWETGAEGCTVSLAPDSLAPNFTPRRRG